MESSCTASRSFVVRTASMKSCFAITFLVSLPRMSFKREIADRSSFNFSKYTSGLLIRHLPKVSTTT